MAKLDLIMPKMGESIMEATILKWLKKEGDPVALDESILEIATDKVDSEVPAPEAGIMGKPLFAEGETIAVGTIIASIITDGEEGSNGVAKSSEAEIKEAVRKEEPAKVEMAVVEEVMAPLADRQNIASSNGNVSNGSDRFYSPLVMNIARKESISGDELHNIPGSGQNGRVTKKDILSYVKNRGAAPASNGSPKVQSMQPSKVAVSTPAVSSNANYSSNGNVEIIEMDRMRKLIADHMVMSKQVSPHVTSFVEADVTNIVNWRNKIKGDFQKREGEKITFTPIFIEAVAKALKDFPLVNSSVDGHKIIVKKDINIGIAAALPSGNLIVPVVKNADHKSLVGITKNVNSLVAKARANKLAPDDIQGGTFTLTNVGTFGNLSGTPIINQPQVAILATGAIKKKPAVLETEYGDVIAIRHLMFMSLSYDHRSVDGYLGGSFLRRVADYLEAFDQTRTV